MNTNINPELQADLLEDAKYLTELNHYVNTLATPSAEAVALYSAKLSNLEDIHTEIRAKYPNFMPIYDTSTDSMCNHDLGKYQEMSYSISQRDMRSE